MQWQHCAADFLYVLPVTVASSSSDGKNAMKCIMYFRFVGDAIFNIMERIDQNQDDAYVSSSSPGGGTSRTSDNVV